MDVPKSIFGIKFQEDCSATELVRYFIQGRGFIVLLDDGLV